jgi:asparagine synthase (glutamine-hydrolysing)
VAFRALPRVPRFGLEVFRARRTVSALPWLTERGRAALSLLLADDWSRISFGWGPLLRDWMWRSRYYRVCTDNFDVMGAPFDVKTHHPFADADVLRSLAQLAPRVGVGSRRALMQLLVGDLVPRELVERESKASFTDPLWTPEAVGFARDWSGAGLDERFVDPERVQGAWLDPDRSLMTTTMLQAAWLADHRGAAPPR